MWYLEETGLVLHSQALGPLPSTRGQAHTYLYGRAAASPVGPSAWAPSCQQSQPCP